MMKKDKIKDKIKDRSMVKVSDLKTADQIEEEARTDPEVRRELDRTALANDVAIRVIRYRADHGLSQTQLARKLGMHQQAIARLEAGDHEPSLSTLARLVRELGISFDIRITAEAVELSPETQEQPDSEAAAAAEFLRSAIPPAESPAEPGAGTGRDDPASFVNMSEPAEAHLARTPGATRAQVAAIVYTWRAITDPAAAGGFERDIRRRA